MKLPILSACALAISSVSVVAQDLPKTKLNVVGSWGMVSMYTDFTQPFFTSKLPEASGGAITSEIRPFNELGMNGSEIMRLIQDGALQFAETPMGYLIGDNALNGGNDLPGLAPDIETARAISDAWQPVMAEEYRKAYGAELLGVYPYSAQVVYCRDAMTGLSDLEGRKIRASGSAIGDFVEALGATAVSMSFGEVVQGLQTGVIDCAITGSMSGFNARWSEVATHIYELPIAWSPVVLVANGDVWDGLDAQVQEFLIDQIAAFQDEVWNGAGSETVEGFACNAGEPACTRDNPGSMTRVPVSDEDIALRDKILRDVVLANWGEQCGTECVSTWNSTVGKVVGVEIK
ncbi:TRAP transporter substrate-binding protein [Roseibium sp. MMSF_3544]|uniref:TRAP transporter substrate-binding protein n=1 Tax=unclassified Roseibium TaxID=2629323 RepID=UPI00273DEAC2|nr:TRAP transporter substrate-binding protein [Roseibium sp. MMSF_3544]